MFVDEQMLCGESLGVLDHCCRLFGIVGLPPPTAEVELDEYLYNAFFPGAIIILRDFRSNLPRNDGSNNYAQIVYDNLSLLDAVWLFIHTADFYLLETFWDVAMMLVEVCEADAEGLIVALWCQALEVEVDKAEDEDRNDDMKWRELSRKRKQRFISNGNRLLDVRDTRIGHEDLPRATMSDLKEAWKYGRELLCPRMP